MAIHSFVEYNEAMADYVDSKVSLDPKEITVDYSNIISIADAFPKAAKDVKLKVTPKQDLHGYVNPWVGGAGKNKLPMILERIKAENTTGTWNGNSYSLNGLTFVVQMDNDGNVIGIKVSGTASALTQMQVGLDFNNTGNFILSGCPSGGSYSTFDLRTNIANDSGGDKIDLGSGVTFSRSSSIIDDLFVVITIRSGYACPSSGLLFQPQIETGSTKTVFEQYENICPITGWTEANIPVSGKNLLSGIEQGAYVAASGYPISSDKYCRTKKVKIKGGVTVAFSIVTSKTTALTPLYWKGSTFIGHGDTSEDATSAIATIPENADTIAFDIYNSTALSTTDITSAQIEAGSIPTEYEVYIEPTEYTINLGDTRYGATLDVDSGVLTVTHIYKEFTSTDATSWYGNSPTFYTSWTKVGKANTSTGVSGAISSAYLNVTKSSGSLNDGEFILNTTDVSSTSDCIILKDTRFSSASDFKASLTTPLQIVYELATPVTVQLTAEEVQLLLGYNTLFGDTGDIQLTYNPATYGNIVGELGDLVSENQALASYDANTGVKNLLKPYYANGYTTTIGTTGTFTANSDGSVTIASDSAVTAVDFKLSSGQIYPAGKYIISGIPAGASAQTFGLWYAIWNAEHTGYYKQGYIYDDTIIDVPYETEITLYLEVTAGYTIGSKTYYPMIRDASIADDSYQPYAKTNVELTAELGGYKTGIFTKSSSDIIDRLSIKQFGKVVTVNGYIEGVTASANSQFTLGTISGVDVPPVAIRTIAGVASAGYNPPEQVGYLSLSTGNSLAITVNEAITSKVLYFSFSYTV